MRVIGRLLVVVALVAASLLVMGPASACPEGEVEVPIKKGDRLTYGCVKINPDAGQPGTDPVQIINECDFEGIYNDLCVVKDACFINDPAAVQNPKELEGRPPPKPDSHVVYIGCRRPDGTEWGRWYWSDEIPGTTMTDRVIAARGSLRLPTITATFNPPDRTFVNLETWWWAEGAPEGEVVGSEAFGLRAVASPRGLTVDPGDGTRAFTCDLAVSESDACTYTYRRRGDHTATVSITYDLRFEVNGSPIDVPGVSADLLTMTASDTVDVQVREIQSRVTKVR